MKHLYSQFITSQSVQRAEQYYNCNYNCNYSSNYKCNIHREELAFNWSEPWAATCAAWYKVQYRAAWTGDTACHKQSGWIGYAQWEQEDDASVCACQRWVRRVLRSLNASKWASERSVRRARVYAKFEVAFAK